MVDARPVHRHMVDVDPQRLAQVAEGDRVEVAGPLEGLDDLAGFPEHEGQRVFRQQHSAVSRHHRIAHIGVA